MNRLSIITPTYNRASLLRKCYRSLLEQTCYDFEWIVVDDGSTDDTESVVKSFDTDLFPIIYVKKKNGGKHTALNTSHAYIHGEYVLILDSDDILAPDAVEQVLLGWNEYKKNRQIAIVTFLRGDKDNRKPFCFAQDEKVPVDIMAYKRTCITSSDCCEIIRTEVFKEFPFPVYENEKFCAEGALWSRVSFEYQCVYINKVIYLCEYLEGGLTQSGRAMFNRNPRGGMFNAYYGMDKKNDFKHRIKSGLLFTNYGFFAKMKPIQIIKESSAKGLTAFCLPFGWLLYLYWKRKYE